MAMGLGGGPQRAEINVTPMIDILLVLIIIFLVVTPRLPHGLDTEVPQPPDDRTQTRPSQDIVIEVARDHTIQVNRQVIEVSALSERLKELWKLGAGRVVFVRGDRELEFAYVAEVIDIAKGAGYRRIALMP
jgi:biopolymer transport protein ExbD